MLGISIDRFESLLNMMGSTTTTSIAREKQIKRPVAARTTLWYMTFFGFAVDHMVRININISMVDMIVPDDNSSRVRVSLERSLMDVLLIDYDKDGFEWNENHQAVLLGAFYWLYWTTQLPGGQLARRFGAKLVFGLANLVASLLSLLMPICAFVDTNWLIALRVLQGMVCGLSWPAMHTMISHWVPPDERSEFMTAYHGSAFGIAVFYPVFGFLISMTSWEWSYYLSGIIGVLWFVCWHFLVFETPAEHPRISAEEREYIEMSLGDSAADVNSMSTPFKAILTSRPVWMIAIGQWGGTWCSTTLITQGPTYFRRILQMSLLAVGFLTGLPHFLKFICSYGFSTLGDRIIHADHLTRKHVRRFAGAFCYTLQGFFAICLACSGRLYGLPMLFYTLTAAASGAESTGPLTSLIDLSPNFAGIVVGLVGMLSASTMYFSPLVVGWLTLDNQTHFQWQYIFLIAGVLSIVCGIPYITWSTSNVQQWNGHNLVADVCEMDAMEQTVRDMGEGGNYRSRPGL